MVTIITRLKSEMSQDNNNCYRLAPGRTSFWIKPIEGCPPYIYEMISDDEISEYFDFYVHRHIKALEIEVQKLQFDDWMIEYKKVFNK